MMALFYRVQIAHAITIFSIITNNNVLIVAGITKRLNVWIISTIDDIFIAYPSYRADFVAVMLQKNYNCSAATAGNTLPSTNSKNAPPPVDI